jgi:GTP-binding protein
VTLNFIDTAGLRKRSKVEDEIEFYSTLRTDRAVEGADVCVLVVDAVRGVEGQEVRIAEAVWDRGVGLVVAVTKWDLIAEKDATTGVHGEREIKRRAPFLAAVPFVYVSSVTGFRVRRVLDLILDAQRARTHRVATSEVNRVLRALVERQQPPQAAGREVKLLYGSQVGIAPPTFALVTSQPEAVGESYRRYLEHGFRDAWGFLGSPIRIKLKPRRS